MKINLLLIIKFIHRSGYVNHVVQNVYDEPMCTTKSRCTMVTILQTVYQKNLIKGSFVKTGTLPT